MSIDLGTLGAVLAGLAAALALAAFAADRTSWPRRQWRRYVRFLDGELRFLFASMSGLRLALLHAAALGAVMAAALALRSIPLALCAPVVALVPGFVLAGKRARRVRALEMQLDVWLRAVANALKAAPAIGDALRSSAALVPAPLQQEVELVLKEMALGVPLDEALHAAGERVGSATFSSAIATLLIARKTGGNLPVVLEQAASTLREMERLEGVLRTKTADSKAQAYALGAIPFALIAFLQHQDADYFSKFTGSGIGIAMLVGAGFLWVGSIVAARRILNVDM